MKQKFTQPHTILIIDDNLDETFILKELLSIDFGNCNIISETDGRKCIDIATKNNVDIILLDIQMPIINGFDVALLLKSNEKTKDIPIIFVTAIYNSREFKDRGFEVGAIDYITKPIDDGQLVNKLNVYLKLIEQEKELKQSEERFRELFNYMDSIASVFKISDDGKDFIFTDFNKAGEKAEKIEKSKLIGESFSKLVPKSKRDEIFKIFEKVYKTGNPEDFSLFSYNENDEIEYFKECNIYKLPTGELVSICKDVTLQKKMSEDILKSEVKHWFLLESIDRPILAIKKNMEIFYCNEAFAKLIGKTITQIERDSLLNVFPMLKELPSYNAYQTVLTTEEQKTIEYKIENKHIIENISKTPWGIISIFNDITELRKQEEQIKMLSIAVEQSSTSVLITDSNGIIIYANQSLTKQVGYSLEEIKGNAFEVIFPRRLYPNFYDKMIIELRNGLNFKCEINTIDKSGDDIWQYVSISPVRNSQGVIVSFVALLDDITPRKRYEEKLSRLNEELENKVIERTILLKRSNEELDEKNKQLDVRNQAIEYDLKLAQKVQQQIITQNIPNTKDYRFVTFYEPMESVGGDFYEFIIRREGEIGLFICDVSGHGASAALITSMLKMLCSMNRGTAHHPALFLKHINESLFNKLADNFVTAFYGVFHPNSKVFKYSNAGHSYPILYREKENRIMKLSAIGGVMGVSKHLNYEEKEIQLEKHDKLILFTDGLTEAVNENSEFYGRKRLYEYIIKHKDETIENLSRGIYEDLNSFRNRVRTDDIALIGVEVK